MRKVTITRPSDYDKDEYGVFGTLQTTGFVCRTVERPWLGNAKGISCIPEGTYRCVLGPSQKNHPVSDYAYEVTNVPGRSLVKIHIANWPRDLEGCIGLGAGVTLDKDGNRMVTLSIKTVTDFMELMHGDEFELEIRRADGNS